MALRFLTIGPSAGGLGDCFMGPAIKTWQGEWQQWVGETDSAIAAAGGGMDTTDGITVPYNWLPNKNEDLGRCYPSYLESKQWDYFAQNPGSTPTSPDFTADDDELIVQVEGCTGANNCYPIVFKLLVSLLYVLHMVGHHCFVQFVLHGSFVARLRKQKESEGVEMKLQQPLVTEAS